MSRIAACAVLAILFAGPRLEAQGVSPGGVETRQPLETPPPATKLEAFSPASGSLMTMAYDDIGSVGGVSVDARELRDAQGAAVRGLVVQVYQSEFRQERSFVDADEILELIRGIDALLEVSSNPTKFSKFEVRYTTKGELQLTAYNSTDGTIRYAIQAGRVLKAQRTGLSVNNMRRFRDYVSQARDKLLEASVP